MHGYVAPSRIGTFACTTLQLEFSVYSGKKKSRKKKYVRNLELINKDKKKKERVGLCARVMYENRGVNVLVCLFCYIFNFKYRFPGRIGSIFSGVNVNYK